MATSVKLTKDQHAKLDSFTTMSARIRYLLAIGLTRGQVAKKLNIIYQWVYNVDKNTVGNYKESIK